MARESDFLRKFGKKVKTLRIQKGISSQIALANKAHLDRTYIGGIERGERNLGLKNVEKIAKALEINPEDLFKF